MAVKTKIEFRVKLRPLKLERVHIEDQNSVQVKIKWIGQKGNLSFINQKNYCTSRKKLTLSNNNGDQFFERLCKFSMEKDGSFCSWIVSFDLFYGDSSNSVGRVSMNLAELLGSKIEDSSTMTERKLPICLQINGVSYEASLLVQVSLSEIRSDHNIMETIQSVSQSEKKNELSKLVKRLMKVNKNKNAEVRSCDSDESSLFDSSATSPSTSSSSSEETSSGTESASLPETRLDPVKTKFFSWRKLSFRKKKIKSLINKSGINHDDVATKGTDNLRADLSGNEWEMKELVSRDGKAKLKSKLFFASFDQRSEEASGESACTAVVTVIAYWLQSNRNSNPTMAKFDSLITEGYSLWHKLCDDDKYTISFPDKHFDLETVLEANPRPIFVLRERSFTGFFSPEKFESLKEAMSFDQIWNTISENNYETRIYIVSWNDHFFVLRAEADAFYIIDSLGERLFGGCNQAYILKFDESSVMYEKKKILEGEDEIICRGKECCREYIKRFLAAISLAELEEEEKKKTVSTFSLLRRLQIDFNFCSSPLINL